MRIAMIGTGYVGLVSGVCFSDFGHDVVCVDRDADKIAKLARGEATIYEQGLDPLLVKNLEAGRLRFTTDLADAVDGADAVFIAVGTPSRRGDGHADLSYVYAAAEQIVDALRAATVLVIKSTVPVGCNREVSRLVRSRRPALEIPVASNPEFLREGAAIADFMRPDRVVIGVRDESAGETLRALYRPLALREVPIVVTAPETAELAKYAANAFLAMKVTFINEIADLCEKVGADVQDVARSIGLDGRIGPKFLHPGPGYGGSCFPKDTLALAQIGRDNAAPLRLVETTIEVNAARKRAMVDKVAAALDWRLTGRRITLFGATFKPETDDMRDAPSLTVAPALIGQGAAVTICDPLGRREGAALLPGAAWVDDPYEAATGADATVLLTEWNMFRGLSLRRLREVMAGDVLIDLRNVWRPEEARVAGFAYLSVGRP
jgi:UDPglucose 6-dehydrogenase